MYGGPSVIAQRPYDERGEPFPTTFWLSCRVLVRAVGGAALATSLEGGAPAAPLKCLHAHAAAALAAPPYALGRLVLERARPETPEACCAWA